MAHSSFPQIVLLFRFLFTSIGMPRAEKVCPGFSAGVPKRFLCSHAKKSQAGVFSACDLRIL
jgi:hypothetical protein